MPSLHLPASFVNRQLDEQVEAHRAEARHWTQELRRIDPGLSVVWVRPTATDPELTPGRWHIKKEVSGSYNAYLPLIGPGGEYREPGPWILDWLQAADMWNPRVQRDQKEAKRKLREARVRARKREAEARQDEIALGYRAGSRMRGDSGFRVRTDLKRAPEKKKAKA